MSKNLFKSIAIAAVAISAVAAIAIRVHSAKPPVVTIGYQVVPNGESFVKSQAWYEKELGAKVELKQFESGRDVNTALASGSIDFGQLGTTPAAVGISKGLPYQVVWIHDVIGQAEALAAKNGTGISSLADLAGKKIAVPFSSTAHYSLLNALKLNGIDEKSVTIVDLQPQDILAAWQRGDIQAAYVWEPTLSKLKEDGAILTSSKELAEKGVITADIEVVRTDFAKKHPDIVAKYVKQQLRANATYAANPGEVISAIAKLFNVSNENAKSQIDGLVWLSGNELLSQPYFGTSEQKGDLSKTLKATADFLVAQKAIDKAPDQAAFDAAVNPSFIEKALKL